MIGYAYWRYELVSRHNASRRREGALIRASLPDGLVGYADCHPWPELGDAPLDRQLDLSDKRNSLHFRGAQYYTVMDAFARRDRRSLFAGLSIPPSHASFPDAMRIESPMAADVLSRLAADGFRFVKVKGGDDVETEIPALARLARLTRDTGLKIRLDVNAKLGASEVRDLLARLGAATDGLEWLDWVEDPCPYDIDDWRRLRDEFGCRLAFDRAGKRVSSAAGHRQLPDLRKSADVVVCKPAADFAPHYLKSVISAGMPICVTSYLDHPVGQAFAAQRAALLSSRCPVEACGLLTHDVYEPNAFSERLGSDGPVLIPPTGTGIGFDDLLEALPWVELK
ncbi:MAG: enolase C-terminal domain-like protein [Fimbriimonadaceae bacterium]